MSTPMIQILQIANKPDGVEIYANKAAYKDGAIKVLLFKGVLGSRYLADLLIQVIDDSYTVWDEENSPTRVFHVEDNIDLTNWWQIAPVVHPSEQDSWVDGAVPTHHRLFGSF